MPFLSPSQQRRDNEGETRQKISSLPSCTDSFPQHSVRRVNLLCQFTNTQGASIYYSFHLSWPQEVLTLLLELMTTFGLLKPRSINCNCTVLSCERDIVRLSQMTHQSAYRHIPDCYSRTSTRSWLNDVIDIQPMVSLHWTQHQQRRVEEWWGCSKSDRQSQMKRQDLERLS